MKHVSEIAVQETERSPSARAYKGHGGGHITNHGQQVMSV